MKEPHYLCALQGVHPTFTKVDTERLARICKLIYNTYSTCFSAVFIMLAFPLCPCDSLQQAIQNQSRLQLNLHPEASCKT